MIYKTAVFLRELRKKKHLSLRKLSSICNIATSSLSDIENSKFRISSKHIDSLICALTMAPNEIEVFLKCVTLDRSEIYDKTMMYFVNEQAIYNHVKNIYGYEISSDKLDSLVTELNKSIELFIQEDSLCQY